MLTLGGGGLKTGASGGVTSLGSHISYSGGIIAIGTGSDAVSFAGSGSISFRNSQNISFGTLGSEFLNINAATGQITFANSGTKMKFSSGGTTDYLSSDGSAKITAAGDFAVTGSILATTNNGIYLDGSTRRLYWDGSNINSNAPVSLADKLTLASFTDDSATTGNRTVNKVRGFNAFAAGTSAITITNSFVSTSSQIVCTIMTNDATALLKNVVPGSGSFVITLNANTTGITKVAWTVIN